MSPPLYLYVRGQCLQNLGNSQSGAQALQSESLKDVPFHLISVHSFCAYGMCVEGACAVRIRARIRIGGGGD